MTAEKWHTLKVKRSLELLGTDEKNGLNDNEVKKRIEQYGGNELEAGEKKSVIKIFLSQFTDLLVIILMVAALISGFLGEMIDSAAILAIVILNAIMGTVQEYRAEKALEAIKNMIAPKAKVIRNGKVQEILSKGLVPGDIVILAEGDKVPADLRLIESNSLHVNEAILTGESLPVDKHIEALDDVLINDRKNTAFANTLVTYGNGKGVVVGTGMTTEFGKIAKMLDIEEEQLPLQKNLDIFSKQLAIIILGICFIVFLAGVLKGGGLLEFFMVAVSLAVAAIPEGLPAIVTMSLAAGVYKLAKENAIMRKLAAVETLGSVSVICSDKTGTLTRNELSVASIYTGGEEFNVTGEGYIPEGKILKGGKAVDLKKELDLSLLITAGVGCNDANLRNENGGWSIIGDPTEGALLVLAEKAGITTEGKKVYEIPFTSERKMMSVIYGQKDGYIVYSKGAPEILLHLCSQIQEKGHISKITPEKRKELLAIVEKLAKNGQRVIAIAYSVPKCSLKKKEEFEDVEKNLVLVGLVGIIDLPRKEAIDAIAKCKSAGIKLVMITGDHKSTATAIAAQMGLIDEGYMVITGEELDKLSEKEFDKVVDKIAVYARVSPEHKLRIVTHLKKKGHIVAMTGDGVNDAPAIKKADIGIAMGISGTDVAKESSRMILADDNFATIVTAVEGGRVIYGNIKNAIKFLLTCNFAEVMIIFIAIMLNWPLPLLPIQILMMNLLTDGLPALALGMDPGAAGVMNKEPRSATEKILSKEKLFTMIPLSFVITALTLGAFYISLPLGETFATTVAFTLIVFLEHAYAFSCRSDKSILNKELFANKYLWAAQIVSLIIQVALVEVAWLHPIMKTSFMTANEWGAIIALSLGFFVAEETIGKKLGF